MPTPKIFVCHSAKSVEDKNYLERVASGLNEATDECPGFDVLYDTNLRCGDDWNATIHGWLELCHGAVVLMSKQMLESQYARYELSNLHRRWRTKKSRGFRLLIVALPPATIDGLKGDELATAIRLDDAQFVDGGRDDLIDELRKGLEESARAVEVPQTRLQVLERLLIGKVNGWVGTSRDLLVYAAEQAQCETERWVSPEEYVEYYVHDLLSREMPTQYRLTFEASATLNLANSSFLFHHASAMWIHPEAAEVFADSLAGPGSPAKAVVVNGAYHPFTPTMFLLRAKPNVEASLRGHVVESTFDLRSGESLVDLVRTGLIEQLPRIRQVLKEPASRPGGTEEEELERLLELAADTGRPIVVSLKLDPFDLEELADLQVAFRHHVSFFVLCSGEIPPSEHWQRLEPAFPERCEEQAQRDYNRFGRQLGLDGL